MSVLNYHLQMPTSTTSGVGYVYLLYIHNDLVVNKTFEDFESAVGLKWSHPKTIVFSH